MIVGVACHRMLTMRVCREPAELTPAERRRRIASILAKGAVRWRKRAKAGGFVPVSMPSRDCKKALDLPGHSRLSVSDGTRGFTPRGDGDDA